MLDFKINAFDIIYSLGYIILFSSVSILYYNTNKEKPGFKYFYSHFIWKIVIATFFAIIYTTYYGGDTTAYFEGGLSLKNLFLENPSAYFQELFSGSGETIPQCFNTISPKPPSWIYYEDNSWFVSKLVSIICLFSFDSFLCATIICSFLVIVITWRFYLFLISVTNIQERYLAIAILFIPTAGFWCTGLSKDTIVVCSVFGLIKSLLVVLINRKITFKQFLLILLCSYMILMTRSFVLIAILMPTLIYMSYMWSKKSSFIVKLITQSLSIAATIGMISLFINNSQYMGEYSFENILKTAETTYKDFSTNSTYLGSRYDLGIETFTTTEIIKAFPLAMVTAIYRPFLWESSGALMIMNGIEGLFLLFFSIAIFRKKSRIASTKFNESTKALVFLLIIYCIIMAFFVGFTSALFGVLVRMKASIIPFFLIVVFSKITTSKLDDEVESNTAN